MAKPPSDACPCNPARDYSACCGRFHAGDAAPDAETLMRSRYSAYARGLRDYLLATWHASTRPAELELDDTPNPHLRWLGLDVLEHHRDDPDHARVRFVARFRVGGQSAQRMRELSRFVREGGRWFYVDGDVDQTRRSRHSRRMVSVSAELARYGAEDAPVLDPCVPSPRPPPG